MKKRTKELCSLSVRLASGKKWEKSFCFFFFRKRSPFSFAQRTPMPTIYGAPEGQDALLLLRRAAEHGGPLLHIARDDNRMNRLADLLGLLRARPRSAALPRLGLPAVRPR